MQTNPFAQILRPYFDLLSGAFENLAKEVVKHNVEPDDVARDFLSRNDRRERFNRQLLPEIESKVTEFWRLSSGAILAELSALAGLKALFGGDVGPQRRDRLFERLGVYFDSMIVPDPVLRSFTLLGPSARKDYYTLKYCIAQVLFRDIYLAHTYPPIAVLIAEGHLLEDSNHFQTLRNQSLADAISVTNAIFAQDFDTEEEVMRFLKKIGTASALAREVANAEIFRLVEEAGPAPAEQIEALEEHRHIDWKEEELAEEWKDARSIWMHILGRMMQANELLQAAKDRHAHPVIQAPISFHWLTTKVRLNATLIEEISGEKMFLQLPVTNALLSRRLEWLSNVPVESLIRLREQGFLGQLRTVMALNFSELTSAPLDRLEESARRVDSNLQTALNRHQEEISTLNQTLIRNLTISVPTFLLAIGAALQPLSGAILPSWLVPVSVVGGTVSLKDIISDIATHVAERRRLAQGPIGILWNARGAT